MPISEINNAGKASDSKHIHGNTHKPAVNGNPSDPSRSRVRHSSVAVVVVVVVVVFLPSRCRLRGRKKTRSSRFKSRLLTHSLTRSPAPHLNEQSEWKNGVLRPVVVRCTFTQNVDLNNISVRCCHSSAAGCRLALDPARRAPAVRCDFVSEETEKDGCVESCEFRRGSRFRRRFLMAFARRTPR